MDSRIKRFFNKGKGNGKSSGNQGSANDTTHLDPRGNPVRSKAEEHINQSPTVSEKNQAELKNEYGIKVLHSPDQPRAEYALKYYQFDGAKQVDSIIFVHGLTGSQLSTWTASGATAAWPYLLLPDDIPDARISAFGYDADVVNLLGTSRAKSNQTTCKESVRGNCRHVVGYESGWTTDTFSNNAEQHERRVLECTQAIAFLGTPHRGSELASWATIAGNMVNVVKTTNTDLLEVLKPSSEVLENLTQDFHTMLRSREQAQNPSMKITCFVEELPVSKAGKTFMVVPSRSATLERYAYVTMYADHISMTKFKDRNNDYKNVMLQLKRWMEELAVTERTLDKTLGLAKSDPNTGNLIRLNIPKKNVSHFVTRLDIFKELDIYLWTKTEATSVVLLGMGGSGKTQLALECCRRAEADPSFTAVIWIDASSPATVAQSYSTIALKIHGGPQSISDVEENIANVERTLQQQKGKWFIVLDNFDNPKDFQEHNIQYYIPKAANGRVLFTSRHGSSERLGHVIRVSGMSDDESLNLLLQRPTSETAERQQGLAIAATLGHLALALDQAGAYIRARCLPLRDFGSHYQRRKKIILEEVPEQWEYRRKLGEMERETVLSVFITWELSFAQICGNKEARDRKEHFLTLAAHFDNKCVSQRYFQAYCTLERAEWAQTFITRGDWDEYIYEDLLAECSKLSLLQMLDRRADGAQFSLHPVVGDWLKVRKERENQILYAEECAELLTCYIEGVSFNELNLQVKQETLLHIDACMQNDRDIIGNLRGSALEHRSYSISLFASCYQSTGRYDDAEELYKRALASREEKLGSDYPDTLETIQDLANIYKDKGQYDDAEELYKRALAGREEKLGPDHPDTLKTVQTLAFLYRDKGRYDDAEELSKRALAGKEKKLGPDHPDTLRTVHNLAIISMNKGRYNDAEELFKRVLAGNEEKLGPDHLDTLKTVETLAILYWNKGRYNDAEELYKRALAGNGEKLGPDHPDTLRTVQNLALVYWNKGQYDDAEELSKRALAGREEKLGPDHPDMLGLVENLALVYQDKGRYDDAEELSKRAFVGREEKLGPDHPDTLRTVETLALVYRDKGRYDDAEKLSKRALAGREKKLGPDHPDTLKTVQNLALVYRDKGRYDDAEELSKRALAGNEEKLGPDHPETLKTVQTLAIIYRDKGRYDDAEELYKCTLAGREEKLGPDHPETLKTVQNLAIVYRDKRRYDDAEELYKRALAGREEKLGPDHPDTL
ncbi:hypothetical protein MMC21_005151 [Puttea exsequens]|nr:hypothetical protein [Puttea exsequens]